MNSSLVPRQLLPGFAVAVLALGLGVYFSTKLAHEEIGGFLLRLFSLLALLAFVKTVLAWGRIRGYPLRREDGRIHFGHLVRNLTMAAVVTPVFMILSGPFVMAAFQLAR